MNPLPLSAADLVDHIKRCDVWQERAYESFGLQRAMFSDIASLAKHDEGDLPPLANFFAESAKERLSVPGGGKWTWRTRDSITGYKSPYLDWLKGQWAAGRWKDDETIHSNACHFLDPRFARFESLKYLPGASNLLGKPWPAIVKGYRDLVGREALRRSGDEPIAASKVSKAGVEAYTLHYFERRGWACHSSASQVGNIVTVERPLLSAEYVFRAALSLAGKGLLDHIDGWISVTLASADLAVVRGGPSAMIATSIGDLLLPASTYYLTHDKDRLRIVNAMAFVNSVLQAMTQPVQVA